MRQSDRHNPSNRGRHKEYSAQLMLTAYAPGGVSPRDMNSQYDYQTVGQREYQPQFPSREPQFIPSEPTYGASAQAAAPPSNATYYIVEGPPPGSSQAESDDYTEYVKYMSILMPSLTEAMFGESVKEKVELLKVKLAELKAKRKAARWGWLKDRYSAQIKKTEALLRAAKYELESEQTTDQIITYGSAIALAGGVLGLFVLVQGIRLLSATTEKTKKST
jgi:uncharacterized protein YacL (UPF0231 family)